MIFLAFTSTLDLSHRIGVNGNTMTSTIGIPIKLLNEAQVSSGLCLALLFSLRRMTAAKNIIIDLGSCGYARDQFRTSLPR